MVMTNFPGGVTSFGIPLVGSPDVPSTNGKYIFVSSVIGADGYDGSYETPYGTLAYAVTKTSANKGDVIIVLPFHRETVASAGAIPIAIAGTTIVGWGYGNERPVLTFSTGITSSVLITAANVTIKNIVCTGGITGLTNPFSIQAGGDNCTLDFEWQDVSGTYEANRAILVDTVSNLKVKLRFIGGTSLGGVNGVRLRAVTGARIEVDYYGLPSTAVVQMQTACTDVIITGSMYVVGTATGALNVVDTAGTSTWSVDAWDASAGAWWLGSHTTAPAFWTAAAVAAALYGAGVTTWPAAATYGNGVSIAAVEAYIQDGVRRGAGTILPAATSLYDLLAGTNGIPVAWPTPAAYAGGVSMAAVLAYVQAAIRNGTGGTALATNKSLYDAIGSDGTTPVSTTTSLFGAIGINNATNNWVSSAVTVNRTGSIFNRLADLIDQEEKSVATTVAAGLILGTTALFTITGGPIIVKAMYAICTLANGAGGSTMQFAVNATAGGAITLSGASSTLANAVAGTVVWPVGVFATAATVLAPPAAIATAALGTQFQVPPGTLQAIIGTAAMTGSWQFVLSYTPLQPGIVVAASF